MSQSVAVVLGYGLNDDGTLPPWVAARVQKAVDLYKQGVVQTTIFSGGRSYMLPLIGVTEATAMATYAMTLGLPSDSIVVECQSDDTLTNAQKTLRLLPADWEELCVVTSDTQLHRALRVFGWIFGRKLMERVRFIVVLDSEFMSLFKYKAIRWENFKKFLLMVCPLEYRIVKWYLKRRRKW